MELTQILQAALVLLQVVSDVIFVIHQIQTLIPH